MSSVASLSATILFLLILCSAAAHGRRLDGLSSTASQFLAPHNVLRASLGLPPLQWSPQLAKVALWYANQRRADCQLKHSTLDYGENLFWGQGRQWQIDDAVKAWADEQRYYDYGQNSCAAGTECTHYTQMVWRTTQRVGCAKIYCGPGAGVDTYVVCEYDPHGNYIGEKPY